MSIQKNEMSIIIEFYIFMIPTLTSEFVCIYFNVSLLKYMQNPSSGAFI